MLIANLGSGVGLDLLNVLQNSNGQISRVDNYDINPKALSLGRQLAQHLMGKGSLLPDSVVHYHEKSLTKFSGPVHLAVMVSVICGVEDRLSSILLRKVFTQLESGGHLLVSAANRHMHKSSPLTAFLAQHVGSSADPHQSWGLNFRSRETLENLLKNSGFKAIEILNGVDTLPSRILGHPHIGKPLTLPPPEIRSRREGYNWIAIAKKP